MKIRTQLIVFASFALALAGCSTHPQTASSSKINDLGVIDVSSVSSGKPISHTLNDGRICVITPTVLPNGKISLSTTAVNETNDWKTTLVFETPAEKGAYTYALDKDTSITVALTGRSLHTARIPKKEDLGVIDVSSLKPTSHTLPDGRVCTITPTLLPDGSASIAVRIDEPNGSGETKTFQALVDGHAYAFGFDSSTVITMALRK